MALVAYVDAIANLGASASTNPDFWTLAESQFNAWVAAVNANNVGREITVLVKPSQVTSALNTGFTFKTAHPTEGDLFHCIRLNNSNTSVSWTHGTSYTPGTANGGHGTIGGQILSASASFFINNTTAPADVLTIYDTEVGEEFFSCNWRMSSSTYQAGMVVFKTTAGEWVVWTTNDVRNSLTVPAVSRGPSGYVVFPLWPGADVDSATSMFPVVELTQSLYVHAGAGTPLTQRTTVRAANPRFIATSVTTPLQPLVGPADEDWMAIGGGLAAEITGIVS